MQEDVIDRDSGKVVWLTTCNTAAEAHLIMGRLQNEGIHCFLTNEKISVLAPHFSRMFGGGVMIMVDEQDASKAAEILGLKGSEALVCPQCGSKRIKTRLGRHRCRKIFAIAISFLSGLPMHNMQFLFICKDCGKKLPEMPLRSELRYAICLMAFCFLSFQGICQPKTTIYLLPGQGSDSRLFDSLSFDSCYNVIDVIYPIPAKGMTMKQYACTIAGQIDTTAPYILIGVSLGGMICTELCEILEPEKTIIISSAKTPNELPLRYNFQRMVPLYKMFPAKWLHKGAQMLQPVVEPDRRKQKETFKSMLKGKDPVYIRRTIEMIVKWDRKDYDTAIVHIHGNQDHTIPIRRVRCNYTVKGGSHMMTLTRFEQINALLNHELR